jgi:uncharacterized RDD family membrane protein YckC
MKKIEITTPQNVKIEYYAASVGERLLAWLIDFGIMSASLIILSIIAGIILQGYGQTFIFLLTIAITMFYHLIFEILTNGRTVGKIALGLRVVKLTSEPVRLSDYFMRWAFRIVDIAFSIGIIAIITILSSPRSQRIGDYLADTSVVKIRKTDRFSLHRILDLESLKSYEPEFPGVVAFSEEDMLIIKEVIDRNIRFPGEGSTKALELTIKRIEDLLGIKVRNRNINFLKTIIKDYVTLTR